ncbi:MauE/DoxX family redox-associated membrane protein [Kaistella jeonii]|uniref:Methylamine utilisation protein MauE domain-containing protein n=1 Tax=Kaistella jeonii TaxID=266749 RepID=A0A0C1FKN9_9FLAO|nr:hypothetical protein OA86_10765 [Kaistella jeonii]SFC19527.1 Methylamine utilisation protein MauE [Kaistella jeonii]VEI97028.1 Uncharacterised protein [Kaistella jeonii]
MKSIFKWTVTVVAYFFVVLFVYAAASKIFDFENFQVQLAQSPLLSAYAGFISYAVIILELGIAGILLFPKTRKVGLNASFGLMVAFTVYIYLILNHSDFVPCSCGGILEKMDWTQHLVFNIACVLLAITAIVFIEKERAIHFRRTAAMSSLILVVSGGGMVALFLSSEHMMKKENNFTRRFPHHPILEDQSFDLKVNSYYFVGSHGNDVYLGNPSAPFRILKIDGPFLKTDTIDLVPSTEHHFQNLRYQVQNDYLYAYDGSVPVIYASHLDSLKYPLREISSKDAFFDQLVPVSPTQFMMRVEDKPSQKTALATLTLGKPHQVRINSSVLTEKADGGFDADGQLLYDAELGDCFYLFYYRNQILKINNSLKLVGRMKTIDTVTTAHLKIKILTDGRKKMIAPPLLVNRNMTIHQGLIFNESNLVGKHESQEMWKKNTVVDVYTTTPAGYWGSIYVQNRGKNKMSQMLVTDTYFYMMSGNEIIRYRCAQTLTDHFMYGRSRKPISE